MPTNSSLVSIIIPTFNRAHLIMETLDSVLAQTYQNWECIVVDDGSTDTTAEILREYINKDTRFQYHHRPKDRPSGGNAARNFGFEISKGEFIQWFDDDDVMLPEFLTEKCNNFRPEVHFVICSGTYVDKNLNFLESIEYRDSINLFKEYILWNLKVFTPSVLFRKDFLENKILFNLSIQRGQETEFFSRIFFNVSPRQYKIINKSLFLYRQHDATKSIRNREYRVAYNWSKGYISIENLKRGLSINDQEIIALYYGRLIDLFFKSINNKDKTTSKFIIGALAKTLKNKNTILAAELCIAGNYLRYFDKGKYFFNKRWKSIKIK